MPVPSADASDDASTADHSILFDIHRYSNFPEVKAAAQQLAEFIAGSDGLPAKHKVLCRLVRLVVLNAVVAHSMDPTLWVAYSRDRNRYYGAEDRYNKLHIRAGLVAVVDALAAAKYLQLVAGFYNPETGVGRLSRFRPTKNLIKLLTGTHRVRRQMIDRAPNQECIILRNVANGKRKEVSYEDDDYTRDQRTKLTAYNNLIRGTDIRITNEVPVVGVDVTQTFTRRVYCNGSFLDGGRFYGSWWVNAPSGARRLILINGKPAIEIDYSALHPTLLMLAAGLDGKVVSDCDPYTLPGHPLTPELRLLLKLLVLIAINSQPSGKATGRTVAIQAINNRIRQEDTLVDWWPTMGMKVGDLLNAYADAHPELAKHFYTGQWSWLQRTDSDVAAGIMSDLTGEGIPVLMIHDSFMVQGRYEHRLQEVMEKHFERALKIIRPEGCSYTPKTKRIQSDLRDGLAANDNRKEGPLEFYYREGWKEED